MITTSELLQEIVKIHPTNNFLSSFSESAINKRYLTKHFTKSDKKTCLTRVKFS